MYDRQQMCANASAERVRFKTKGEKQGAERFVFPQDTGLFQLDISFEESVRHGRQR